MSGPDVETKALNSSVKTLAECGDEARERILRYLVSRFLPDECLTPKAADMRKALNRSGP